MPTAWRSVKEMEKESRVGGHLLVAFCGFFFAELIFSLEIEIGLLSGRTRWRHALSSYLLSRYCCLASAISFLLMRYANDPAFHCRASVVSGMIFSGLSLSASSSVFVLRSIVVHGGFRKVASMVVCALSLVQVILFLVSANVKGIYNLQGDIMNLYCIIIEPTEPAHAAGLWLTEILDVCAFILTVLALKSKGICNSNLVRTILTDGTLYLFASLVTQTIWLIISMTRPNAVITYIMPPIGTMITSIIACRAFRGLLEAHESRITTEPKVVNLTESNGSSLKRIIKPWVIGKFSKSRGPYRKNAEALPWRLQGSDPNDLGTGVNLDLDLNPNTFVVDFLRAPAGSPGVGSAKSTSGGKSDLLVGEVISNHLLRNEDSFFCRGDDDSIFGDDSTCSFSYGEGFLDGGLRMERTVSDASSDLSLMVSNAKGMEGKDISSFFPLTPSRERFRKESCDLQGTRTRIDVDHRSICVSPHAVFSTGSISPRSSRYRTERDPGKPAPNELLRSRSTCSSKKIFSHREFMFVAQPSYHSVAEECLGQRGRSSSISARQSFRPESVVFVLASAKEEGKESLKQEKGNGLDEDFGSSYHPPAAVPSDACSTVNAAAPLMVPNLEHHHPMPKRQAVRESLHNYSRPRPRPRPWSVDTEDPKSPGLFHKVKMKKSPISFRNPFSVTGMDAIEESGLESQEVEKDGFGGGGESRIPGRGGCQDERALLQVEDEKMESKMGFEAEGEPPEESIDSAAQASTQSDAYGRKTPKRCGSPTEAVVGWWSKPGSMSHRRKTAQVLDGSQGSCLKVVEEGQKGKSLLKHLSDPRSKPVGEDRLDSSTMTIMDRERGGEEESIPPDSTVSPHVVVGKANVSKPPRPLRIRGKMRRVEEEEEKEGRGGRTSSAVMTDSIPRKRMSEGDDGGSRPPIAREEKMTVERGEQKDPSLEEPRERGSEVAKGRWESGKSRSPDAIVPRSGNERDVGGGRSSGWKGEGIRLKVTSSYGPDVERGGDKYYEIQRIERGLESQLSSYDEVQTQSGGDLGREDRWRTSMEGWPSLGGAKRRSTGGGNDPKLSQLPEDVSGSSVDSISGRL